MKMDTVIEDALSILPPSRDLVQHFRSKLVEYEDTNRQFLAKLQNFTELCDRQKQLEAEVALREEEVLTLQRMLSELQVCLLKEREHVLHLNAENDRLKIQELEDRQKIQRLLVFLGKDPNQKFLLADNPQDIFSSDETVPKTLHTGDETGPGPQTKKECCVSLKLKVRALQAQLAEQAEVFSHEINAITAERLVTSQESEVQRRRDAEKIKFLTDKIHQLEEHLQLSLSEELDVLKKLRKCETNLALKKTTQTPQKFVKPSRSHDAPPPSPDIGMESDPSINVNVNSVGTQTAGTFKANMNHHLCEESKLARRMAQSYQSQCLKLEEIITHLKEEHAESLKEHQVKISKLRQELQVLKCRQLRGEQHHRYEVEGFKADIRNLRCQLSHLEKQLHKVVQQLKSEDQSLDLLYLAQNSAQAAQETLDQILQLRSQIAKLEHELNKL